jgi:GT2 family glycosyltransferase
MSLSSISVVIPTYNRERVLLETIGYLLKLETTPREILIVDQTEKHDVDTQRVLDELEAAKKIRWIKLTDPSITHAMNVGLEEAHQEIVLFLDDDIIPGSNLIVAHQRAHDAQGCKVVAGQVLQPGEAPISDEGLTAEFRFASNRRQFISEIMGGNFSIKRELAMKLGGFDENFVQVAYRFEAEFASRILASGEQILFEPDASIRHLKANSGGTRSYGNHLTTIKPGHSVGEYYFLLRNAGMPGRLSKILSRPFRSIRTKHHLSHPWQIPGTLLAECWGLIWAMRLAVKGPRLMFRGVQESTIAKQPRPSAIKNET